MKRNLFAVASFLMIASLARAADAIPTEQATTATDAQIAELLPDVPAVALTEAIKPVARPIPKFGPTAEETRTGVTPAQARREERRELNQENRQAQNELIARAIKEQWPAAQLNQELTALRKTQREAKEANAEAEQTAREERVNESGVRSGRARQTRDKFYEIGSRGDSSQTVRGVAAEGSSCPAEGCGTIKDLGERETPIIPDPRICIRGQTCPRFDSRPMTRTESKK